ncbi:hypothetical protein WJ62_16660 [Burkholderia diffusa]|nr:hypothetical protein WJ62_16660 [Burkholderia diffusa]
MNASRLQQVSGVPTDRMGCSSISLMQTVQPLRAPMKFADSHLILPASLELLALFRFSESRSYLICHHTRLLRNLSTFTLC